MRSRSGAAWCLKAGWAGRVGLMALCVFDLAAAPARATLLLDEPFSYPNGPLVYVAPNNWFTFGGTTGQVNVASGKVILAESQPAGWHAFVSAWNSIT